MIFKVGWPAESHFLRDAKRTYNRAVKGCESVDYQSEGCTAFRQLEEVERHHVDGNNFVTYQKLQFHTGSKC